MFRPTFSAAVLGVLLLALSLTGLGVVQAQAPRSTQSEAPLVQFKDLEGAHIEAEFLYERTFRVDDRIRSNELLSHFDLALGAGDALRQTVNSTIISPNGREKALTSTAEFVLNKPRKGRNGPMVWKFEKGTLTRLQSLLSGARRISFVLKREGDKLTCAVDAAFAREEGISEIETRSTAKPGAKVQWLDIKQKLATCRVVRR
jgi:hypothetical protein